MKDKIKDALCDMYDIKRQSELHKFGKLLKDNDGTSTTILDCINSVISFLEQLDYPELSTKDINKIVEKYGWKPMDTKDGLAWFGGKTHSCLGDHIADEHEDFENIDFLVAGWRRSTEHES